MNFRAATLVNRDDFWSVLWQTHFSNLCKLILRIWKNFILKHGFPPRIFSPNCRDVFKVNDGLYLCRRQRGRGWTARRPALTRLPGGCCTCLVTPVLVTTARPMKRIDLIWSINSSGKATLTSLTWSTSLAISNSSETTALFLSVYHTVIIIY